MQKSTCQQLRLKFREIKTLKNEFDLELGKMSREKGREQIREFKKGLEDKVENLKKEIEAIQVAHCEEEINWHTKRYIGPLFKDIFQKLPEKCEEIRTSPESKKIKRYRIKIGGRSKKQLDEELKSQDIFFDWPDKISLTDLDFTILEKEENVDLVQLAVKDLGFSKGATIDEIFWEARELGLEFCPAEVGPQPRLQSKTKDWIMIAMKKISDTLGYFRIFHLLWDGKQLKLCGFNSDGFGKSYQFVFRLRRKKN
jgi:hypothetical protein